MARFCANCGKELDENAAVCLNCGIIVESVQNNLNKNKIKTEKKKGLPTWAIILIVLGFVLLIPLIFIILIGVFAYNIVNSTMNTFDDYIEETVIQEGTIGDTLTTDEFNITLHEALIYSNIGTDENNLDIPDEGKEYLVFFFEVENISNVNKYISKYDFTGYVDSYEVELAYVSNSIDSIKELDANLPANRKTKGYVAFEVDTTWKDFEIHYEDWFGSHELVFTAVNEDNSDITGA